MGMDSNLKSGSGSQMYNSTRINRHVTRPACSLCALRSVSDVTGRDLTYRRAWTSPFLLRKDEPVPGGRNYGWRCIWLPHHSEDSDREWLHNHIAQYASENYEVGVVAMFYFLKSH